MLLPFPTQVHEEVRARLAKQEVQLCKEMLADPDYSRVEKAYAAAVLGGAAGEAYEGAPGGVLGAAERAAHERWASEEGCV